jgi:hypothetical protein
MAITVAMPLLAVVVTGCGVKNSPALSLEKYHEIAEKPKQCIEAPRNTLRTYEEAFGPGTKTETPSHRAPFIRDNRIKRWMMWKNGRLELYVGLDDKDDVLDSSMLGDVP